MNPSTPQLRIGTATLRSARDRASRLLPFMWRHAMQGGILLSAGSLAFQTLLSLVPLMAVVLSVLKVFPVFASLKLSIGDFLFQNFAPSQAEILKSYLLAFIDKASTAPTLGGAFLITIALFLISTIDHTLNRIWEVHSPRRLMQGFTLYWTVLTLGPVLIGTSLAASSFVWYSVFTDGPFLEMKARFLLFVPFLNSAVAFSLLYLLVPNRKVRFVHALSGGVLTALLFELAKKWFAFYVSSFANFEHIYGALSVVPMLFFWIYLEWIVVLTGAEFVFSLGYFEAADDASSPFDPLPGVAGVIEVLRLVRAGQQEGRFVTMKTLSVSENFPDRSTLNTVVEFLIRQDLLHQTADGGLALTVDLHAMTLFDLYRRIPYDIARTACLLPEAMAGSPFDAVRRKVLGSFEQLMQVPLVKLVDDSNEDDS